MKRKFERKRESMKKLNFCNPMLATAALISAFAWLAMTTTAGAQDIAAVRRALVSADNSLVFAIDSTGAMRGGTNLEITRLDDSGAFVGFYYTEGSPRPRSANARGSITIVRATAPGGNAVRISVNISQAGGSFGGRGLVNTTTLDGAIRLGSSSRPTFMAGTSSFSSAGSSGGPYPFCARLESVPQ
jgi:hypothetical protein